MESYEDQVNQQADIRELCALCKTMECCPEHCCNWDTCKCTDCEYCRSNAHNQEPQVQADPSILIKSTGQEEIKKVKKTRAQKAISSESEKPSEQIRTHDGALIINYEVPIEEEELILAGGIKGIRALRQQRDTMNAQISDILDQNDHNKFSKYEEEKKRQ